MLLCYPPFYKSLRTNYPICRSKIAKLKEEIATLQAELAAIAKAQKEADAMRAEEAAAWAEAKADYESGVEGVGMALQVLRDYYAEKEEAFVQTTHDKATGAASGIIGMLEVVESRGASSRVFVERKTIRSEDFFGQTLDFMANAFDASISPDCQPTQYYRANAEI